VPLLLCISVSTPNMPMLNLTKLSILVPSDQSTFFQS
jgi:hypothetical protein